MKILGFPVGPFQANAYLAIRLTRLVKTGSVLFFLERHKRNPAILFPPHFRNPYLHVMRPSGEDTSEPPVSHLEELPRRAHGI